MQLKTVMALNSITYDTYGQSVKGTPINIKCCVLEDKRKRTPKLNMWRDEYDMWILLAAKSYEPYSTLFEQPDANITYQDRDYKIDEIERINSSGGKPKYYTVKMVAQ